jgi:broad specificity phosphatase PhoE
MTWRTLVPFLVILLSSCDAHAQRAVVIVRHAERADQSEDSPLSSAGVARAELLARILASSGVSAIYTTQFQRTIKTAEPLANLLKLKMTNSEMSAAELVKTLRAKHANATVLVVGHSNTVPEILAALGHQQGVEIGSQEFDNLFIVVPLVKAPPTVVRLRY